MIHRSLVRVFVAAVVVSGPSVLLAQPVNDDSSILVGFPSTTAGSNVGATTNGGLLGGCNNFADVWYAFVAPFSGTAEVTTCGFLGGSASYDTVISIWVFPPPQLGLPPAVITCNDDYCGTQSYASFTMSSGSLYHVAIGGFGGAVGSFALAITGWAPTPSNDSCATATPIGIGSLITGENAGASTGSDPLPPCAPASRDVWYSFVAPGCGTYTVTTCSTGTNFDTVVSVWQGSCGALTSVACNDDGCQLAGQSLNSTVSFAGTTGTTYRISVSGFGTYIGTFSLGLSAGGVAPMSLAFTNNGAGTLGYSIAGGPVGGWAFTALSLNAGAFPSGWFYGIDISIPEVVSQWTLGFPFFVPLVGACGGATVGPFSGLPPGLTLYGVSFGLASPGAFAPSAITSAVSATVP